MISQSAVLVREKGKKRGNDLGVGKNRRYNAYVDRDRYYFVISIRKGLKLDYLL